MDAGPSRGGRPSLLERVQHARVGLPPSTGEPQGLCRPRVPPLPTAGRPATPSESVSTPDHLSHSVFTRVPALVQCSSAETHSRVFRQEVLVGTSPEERGTSPEERETSPFWLVCRKTTECPPGALLGNDQISILPTLKPETRLSKLPGGLDTIRPPAF